MDGCTEDEKISSTPENNLVTVIQQLRARAVADLMELNNLTEHRRDLLEILRVVNRNEDEEDDEDLEDEDLEDEDIEEEEEQEEEDGVDDRLVTLPSDDWHDRVSEWLAQHSQYFSQAPRHSMLHLSHNATVPVSSSYEALP